MLREHDGTIHIRRLDKRARTLYGLSIWPDFTATRSDVDLTVAKAIRTVEEMRSILKLR